MPPEGLGERIEPGHSLCRAGPDPALAAGRRPIARSWGKWNSVQPDPGRRSASLHSGELRDILSDLGGSVAETYPFWAAANWKNGDEAEFANQPAAGPPQVLQDASRETQFTPISRQ